MKVALPAADRKKKRFTIKATTFDKKGRIIATAFNDYDQTHPRQAEYARQAGCPEKQYLHAEVAAIIKSRRRAIHSISIERYDVTGRPALARPCPVCELAIKHANIKWVSYTSSDTEG